MGVISVTNSPNASLPHTNPKLTAVLKEDEKGGYSIKTKGIVELALYGVNFKDAMCQLVRAVNLLRDSNQIPATFDLKKGLEIFFE